MTSLTPTLLFWSVLSIALPALSMADEVRTVALSGQPVPSATDGSAIRSFSSAPTLNNAGQTAFRILLTNEDTSFAQAILSEGSGSLQLVAREFTQAPGAPSGSEFTSFSLFPLLNDSGKVAFGASLRAPLSNSLSGIWTEESGSLNAEILGGTPAPGTVNDFDNIINGIVLLNSNGDIASKFTLEGNGVTSSNQIGIWSTSSGTLGLVARDGNQVPGEATGVQFSIRGGEPVLNEAGQLAFSSLLVGPSVDNNNNIAILSGAPGSLVIKAREGEVAPGTANAVFNSFAAPTINASGNIAFTGFLTSLGVDGNRESGVWAERDGNIELLAQSGSPAPGLANDIAFRSFQSIELNDAGQTAFSAELTGSDVNISNEQSLWLKTVGDPELVLRGGDQAPGTPVGAEFRSFGPLVLNGNGQLAFTAELLIPGQIGRDGPFVGNPAGRVDSSNNSGLWATDSNGVLHLIAREGDLLQLGPNDLRTVDSLDFVGGTGNADGTASGFNDRGQIAFFASFSDGSSGIFVSNAATVILGDTNQNGFVNFMDIPPFIAILIGGEFLEEADINRDCHVNFSDIGPFVGLLIAQ